ncbi:hypothetical protein J6590_067382 [Homalodisca vitripennis]|nr:hypothetical protein J6590_067382 [Homalodisca vitripennis]
MNQDLKNSLLNSSQSTPLLSKQKHDKHVTYVVNFDLTDKTKTSPPVSPKPRAAVT